MKKLILALSALLLCQFTAGAETYKIDPVHSSITFKVRHFFSYVTGRFTKFEGTIHFDRQHPEQASVVATIDARSIYTGNDKRDEDLRSGDFFEVTKFPTITFKSKSVKVTGADTGDIVGTLTMHGVSKEMTLHARFLGKGKGMSEHEISGWEVKPDVIKRSDFGLNWNKMVEGTAVVGEDVTVSINIEADMAP